MSTETTETTELPEGFAIEPWAYAGVRLSAKGSLLHCWIDKGGDGDELHFSGKGRFVIGSVYDATVRRGEGDSCTLRGTPVYTGDSIADDDKRRVWWALDTAQRTRHAAARREANEAKQNALDEAIEPLAAIARSLRNSVDRDAFLAYVIRRLG